MAKCNAISHKWSKGLSHKITLLFEPQSRTEEYPPLPTQGWWLSTQGIPGGAMSADCLSLPNGKTIHSCLLNQQKPSGKLKPF